MSNSALSACLRHLRGKLAVQQHSDNSDEQLLHAFASQRDENAFAALVHRHGPMVLHVCRRVLEHDQDAEDAFQATFLVLARRAAALRKKASLVSFLHGIAYRTALKAKQSAVRRRKHESQTPSRSPTNPVEELSWREVRALLDEEIARLPEIFRSAFILCVLEELSRAEAAQRLGLNENTLSSRLAKARKRLGQRLARRGVELTAVLAASTVATQTTRALSAVLVSSTIQAALGHETADLVSAHVASLAKSAAAPPLGNKIVICLALAAGAVAVVAASRAALHHEPPTPPADPPRAEAPKAADKKPDAVTVRGRVLDPDGKPIKGVRLYWPHWPNPEPKSEEDIAFPLRAKTDAEGRFRFDLPRSDIHPEFPLALLAAADGYGADWAELPKMDAPVELALRLVKDQLIEGRIISTEGKPLAGVRVRALMASKMSAKQLDGFLTEWKRNWQMVHGQQKAPQAMLLPQEEKSFQAVTDKDGRFRIRGAGAERLGLLRLRGAGVPPDTLNVITRAGFDAAPINKIALDRTSAQERLLRHPPLLYGPTITYVAATGRRIEGTVREIGTGKAVPGFVIHCTVGNSNARAIADKEGRYHLENVPKAKLYLLYASPPQNSSWLPMSVNMEDTTGVQPLRVDFTVARGILVSGRVIDKATGKGVRSLVRFAPLPGNPFFDKPGYDAYRRQRPSVSAGADGSLRLAVFPGPGVLMAQAGVAEKANGHRLNPYKQAEFDAKDHERLKIAKGGDGNSFFTAADNTTELLAMEHTVKLLDLAADAGAAKCDLFVDRGATRTLRIEDPDGKPLTGTTIAGVTETARTTFPIQDATCTIFALDPKKPRRLLFLHAKRNLAGTLTLRGDEKEPVIVRLGRTGAATGRVLDAAGKPLIGVDVNLILSDQTGFALYREARYHPTVRTDKDGRFRLEGIVPEVKFTLGIMRGRTIYMAEPHIGVKQAKAGETLDLGDVRVKAGP